jgi:RHS repeat-associated protein
MKPSNICLTWFATFALATSVFWTGQTNGAESSAITDVRGRQVFTSPLEWAGSQEPTDQESVDLLNAIDMFQSAGVKSGFNALEQYLSSHPNSAWAASLHTYMAEHYRASGRYTLALAHWEKAWEETKSAGDAVSKKLAPRVLAGWTRLLGSLGRKEQMDALFEEGRKLGFEMSGYSPTIHATQEGLAIMKANPGGAYRCGSFALSRVIHLLQPENKTWKYVHDQASPEGGFSLQDLAGMASTNGVQTAPAKRLQGEELVVPSVVHWKLDHYAAILEKKGDLYRVADPTFGAEKWMDAETINAEASGNFLVPKGHLPKGWQALNAEEASLIRGKGYPNEIDDDDDDDYDNDDPDCPPTPPADAGDGPAAGDGSDPCSDADNPDDSGDDTTPDDGGMTTWRISEPYITLWLSDSPLFYRLSSGKWSKLQLTYKHRATPVDHSVGGFGDNWECNWISFVDQDSSVSGQATVHLPKGGITKFSTSGAPEYKSSRQMASGSGAVEAPVQLHSRRAKVENYGAQTTFTSGITRNYMTNKVDRYQRKTTFTYETHTNIDNTKVVRPIQMTDIDGRSCSLAYTNASFTYLVTSVTDPYGRIARFFYDSYGRLTNITDMSGLSSSFTYLSSSDNTITNLHTPYGNTGFRFFSGTNAMSTLNRAIEITEPTTEKQLYVYRDRSTNDMVGTYYSEDGLIENRNTFHWDRKQYAQITSTGKTNYLDMPVEDYGKASLKHWLHGEWLGDHGTVVSTLSASAGPIVATGSYSRPQSFSFTYTGQGIGSPFIGTQRTVASVQWATADRIEYERNTWGRPTNFVYYRNGSAVNYTNIYDADGRILLKVMGPHGEQVRGYGYDATLTNLLTSVTNAAGDVVRYTYDANVRLTGVTHPGGLVTTNLYYASGAHAGFLQSSADMGFRTNYFDYLNGNLFLKTNELGLVTTYTHDNLNRLTSIGYPDGTTKSNAYTFLDRTGTKDRLDNWTRFGFNNLRQLVARTNANSHVILYDYCGCGALGQITEMNGTTAVITQYSYDLAGRLTNALYPDGYSVNYVYGSDDRLDRLEDPSGRAVEINYADYGAIASVGRSRLPSTSPADLIRRTFDDYGRVLTTIDANAVTITNGYDVLDRVTARAVIDNTGGYVNGPETFAYSPLGMTNHTDALGHQEWFGYDLTARLVAKTNANTGMLHYNYQPQNHAFLLIDEKNHTNTWHYDEYGRTTNKVDAAANLVFTHAYDVLGRLTNRWTPAKGNTIYRYDLANNLTNVVYPNTSLNIILQYDDLNRPTNMTDGAGSSHFTYTSAGQLLSEGGRWSNDMVGYQYDSRNRSQISVAQPTGSPWVQNYQYDDYWRLQTTTAPAGDFGYTYNGGTLSHEVLTVTYPSSGSASVNNSYDGFGRLLSTALSTPVSSTLNSHGYAYDPLNQRTQQVFTAGNYVNYTYDNIGQLKTALGVESDTTTSRLHEQFSYSYDPAGNLTNRTMNALAQGFGVDNLNQLSSEGRSGTLTVAGTTSSPATNVTVNGSSASLYGDSTFAKSGFTLANGSNPFTAVAQDSRGRQDTNSITVNLPASVTFQYDANGNLTNDGNRVFEYDFENQLTNVYVAGQWRSEFRYDGLGRRRVRREYTWQGAAWAPTNEVRYVYDGKLVVQERDINNLPLVTYTRGLDLSSSLAGAGGIGGLLARTDNGQLLSGGSQAHAYYHSDGNGNVTCLVNTQGAVLARYTYDPFGNILSKSGPMADINPYRFSSKEFHLNSGLIYYLYRFYDPVIQKWINCDRLGKYKFLGRHFVASFRVLPAEMWPAPNLYQFTGNGPINRHDTLGLDYYPDIQDLCQEAESNQAYEDSIVDYAMGEGWAAKQRKDLDDIMHPDEAFVILGVEAGNGPVKIEGMGFVGGCKGKPLFGVLGAIGNGGMYGGEWSNQEGFQGVWLLDPGAGYGFYASRGDAGAYTYGFVGFPGFEVFVGVGTGWTTK